MQAALPRLERLDRDAMRRRIPPLTAPCEYGLYDAEGGDLNVHAILQGYRRRLRQSGVDLCVDAEVMAVTPRGQGWEVACANGLMVRAAKVVNAAGAWADDIGQLAGLPPLGLIPKRRTACLVQPRTDCNVDEWPMVINIDEEVYFKSEAGQLMVSPADETDTVPCDAQPEEIDVAIAIDRFQQIIDHPDAAPTHTWAGLRTFAPDRTFVVGPDPRLEGFYWLAGQGGYGVQSAPAMARLATQMVLDQPIDKAVQPIVQRVLPNRLINGEH
jgi:D-arginine dehydrogenase